MRLVTLIIFFVFPVIAWSSGNQGPPITCFKQDNLYKVLKQVEDKDHFLRYKTSRKLDKEVGKKGCSWYTVPAGSRYVFLGFFQTSENNNEGFIFPIVQVSYSNSGLMMYSAMGIYPRKDWQIQHHTGPWRSGTFIEPKDCSVIGDIKSLPKYVKVPENCMIRGIF